MQTTNNNNNPNANLSFTSNNSSSTPSTTTTSNPSWFATKLGIAPASKTVEKVGDSANTLLLNVNSKIGPVSKTVETVGDSANRLIDNINAKTAPPLVLENLNDALKTLCDCLDENSEISLSDLSHLYKQFESLLSNPKAYFNISPNNQEEWIKIQAELTTIGQLISKIQSAPQSANSRMHFFELHKIIHNWFLQEHSLITSNALVVLDRIEKIVRNLTGTKQKPQQAARPYTAQLKARIDKNKPPEPAKASLPITENDIRDRRDVIVKLSINYALTKIAFSQCGINPQESHKEITAIINKTIYLDNFIEELLKYLTEKHQTQNLSSWFSLKGWRVWAICKFSQTLLNFYAHHFTTRVINFFKSGATEMTQEENSRFIQSCIILIAGVLADTRQAQTLVRDFLKSSGLTEDTKQFLLGLTGTDDEKLNQFYRDSTNPALKGKVFDDVKFTIHMIDRFVPHFNWTKKVDGFFSLISFPNESNLSLLNPLIWIFKTPLRIILKTLVFIPEKILDIITIHLIKKQALKLNPVASIRNSIAPSLQEGAKPLLSGPHAHQVNIFLRDKFNLVLIAMRQPPDFTKQNNLTLSPDTQAALSTFVKETMGLLIERDDKVKQLFSGIGETLLTTLLLQSMNSVLTSLDPIITNLSKKEELLQLLHTSLLNLQNAIFNPSTEQTSPNDTKTKVEQDIKTCLNEIIIQAIENVFDPRTPEGRARVGVQEYLDSVKASTETTLVAIQLKLQALNRENPDEVIEPTTENPFKPPLAKRSKNKPYTRKMDYAKQILQLVEPLNAKLNKYLAKAENDERTENPVILKHLQDSHEKSAEILAKLIEHLEKSELEKVPACLKALEDWKLQLDPYNDCKKLLQKFITIAENNNLSWKEKEKDLEKIVTFFEENENLLDLDEENGLSPSIAERLESIQNTIKQNRSLENLIKPLQNIGRPQNPRRLIHAFDVHPLSTKTAPIQNPRGYLDLAQSQAIANHPTRIAKDIVKIAKDQDLSWKEKIKLLDRLEGMELLVSSENNNDLNTTIDNVCGFIKTAAEQSEENEPSLNDQIDQFKQGLDNLPKRDPFPMQIPPSLFNKIAKPASLLAAKHIIPTTLVPQVTQLLKQEYLVHQIFNRALLWFMTGSTQKPIQQN